MIWWEGDNLTAPNNSNYLTRVNLGEFIFRNWTNYLSSKTVIFYANATISSTQIVSLNFGYSLKLIAEYPSLVRKVLLT
jgi:hypothetical protein